MADPVAGRQTKRGVDACAAGRPPTLSTPSARESAALRCGPAAGDNPSSGTPRATACRGRCAPRQLLALSDARVGSPDQVPAPRRRDNEDRAWSTSTLHALPQTWYSATGGCCWGARSLRPASASVGGRRFVRWVSLSPVRSIPDRGHWRRSKCPTQLRTAPLRQCRGGAAPSASAESDRQSTPGAN